MSIITANKSQFHEVFANWHGGKFKDAFSFEGREAIFDHLKYIENQTGWRIVLDLFGLTCDYNERTESQIRQYYNLTDDTKIEEFLESIGWWKELSPGRYIYHSNNI